MTIMEAKSILGLRGRKNNDSTREDIETFYKELINYWEEKNKQNIQSFRIKNWKIKGKTR